MIEQMLLNRLIFMGSLVYILSRVIAAPGTEHFSFKESGNS